MTSIVDLTSAPIRVLLIEDDPTDALVTEMRLTDDAAYNFSVEREATLASGWDRLLNETFDLVIVDLSLPDAAGLEVLDRLEESRRKVPVVVLSGNPDPNLALLAVKRGAQDFLVKNGLDPRILVRTCRYAVERQRLINMLEEEHEESRVRAERETTRFERIGRSEDTEVSARFYGDRSLSETNAEMFAACVERYRKIVDDALEERLFRVERPTAGAEVMELSKILASLRAGPRDVINLHTSAVAGEANKLVGRTPQHISARMEEARLVALQLMGHLVQSYRNYLPVPRRTAPMDRH